jgi:hypothetical protein
MVRTPAPMARSRRRWRSTCARGTPRPRAPPPTRRARDPVAQRLLALNPLHEGAHASLMQLCARQGRRDSALQQYRLFADRLLVRYCEAPPVGGRRSLEIFRALGGRNDVSAPAWPRTAS